MSEKSFILFGALHFLFEREAESEASFGCLLLHIHVHAHALEEVEGPEESSQS